VIASINLNSFMTRLVYKILEALADMFTQDVFPIEGNTACFTRIRSIYRY